MQTVPEHWPGIKKITAIILMLRLMGAPHRTPGPFMYAEDYHLNMSRRRKRLLYPQFRDAVRDMLNQMEKNT